METLSLVSGTFEEGNGVVVCYNGDSFYHKIVTDGYVTIRGKKFFKDDLLNAPADTGEDQEKLKEKKTMERISIKYHNPNLTKLAPVDGEKSDWIDLRAAERVELTKDQFALISLGVSMKLPDGYEAHIAPRSSTFKNWGIIQTNSVGVIDNSYSGDNDIWKMPVLATRDTVIEENDRICQFRIVKKQSAITFAEVEHLGGTDRGGFGSTGKA